MSLHADQIFFQALTENDTLLTTISNRLYSTAIPLPDEDADNVPVPYVILTFDGLNNDTSTKDDSYEGTSDIVNIGIEVTAADRSSLASLVETIRETIREYFVDYEAPTDGEDLSAMVPYDYEFTAGPVQYDAMKPCYWQTLQYRCDIEITE